MLHLGLVSGSDGPVWLAETAAHQKGLSELVGLRGDDEIALS